jgi:hypothetical protein
MIEQRRHAARGDENSDVIAKDKGFWVVHSVAIAVDESDRERSEGCSTVERP